MRESLTEHWHRFAGLKPHAGIFGYMSLAKLRMSFREVMGWNELDNLSAHAPVQAGSFTESWIVAGVQ
jgi:hypothetical protein